MDEQTITTSDVGDASAVLGGIEQPVESATTNTQAAESFAPEEPAAVSATEQALIVENETMTADLALAKAELETANTRIADLAAQLEAARAEFVSGSLQNVTHSDDELVARWVLVGGGAKDYDLAVRFARAL